MFFVLPQAYNVEYGSDEHASKPSFQYSDRRRDQGLSFLAKNDYTNYIVESRSLGPVVIALQEGGTSRPHALIFHKLGVDYVTIGGDEGRSNGNKNYQIANCLQQAAKKATVSWSVSYQRRSSESDLSLIKPYYMAVPKDDAKFLDHVRAHFETVYPSKIKVGLLFMPKDKGYQDELYSVDGVSSEFTSFLSLITENGSQASGRYVAHKDHTEVLFHCSPHIHMSPEKFIAHDAVVVVFKQSPSDVFVPSSKSIHKTQVYICVSLCGDQPGADNPRYRMQVASKLHVQPFPPFLPTDSVWEHGETFRSFFLAKVVNAHRAATASSADYTKTLENQLDEATEFYLKKTQREH